VSEGQNGKGSKPRPYSVDQKTFEDNWSKTFGAKNKPGKTCMYSHLPAVENYMNEDDDYKNRSKILDELTELSQEMGLYEPTNKSNS
jgi:hypothetical protein